MMVQFCSNSVTGTIIAPAFAWVSVLSSMAGTIFYLEKGSTRAGTGMWPVSVRDRFAQTDI
jgi:hypothetical protein